MHLLPVILRRQKKLRLLSPNEKFLLLLQNIEVAFVT